MPWSEHGSSLLGICELKWELNITTSCSFSFQSPKLLLSPFLESPREILCLGSVQTRVAMSYVCVGTQTPSNIWIRSAVVHEMEQLNLPKSVVHAHNAVLAIKYFCMTSYSISLPVYINPLAWPPQLLFYTTKSLCITLNLCRMRVIVALLGSSKLALKLLLKPLCR